MTRMIRLDEMNAAGYSVQQQIDAMTLAITELGNRLAAIDGPQRLDGGTGCVIASDGMVLVPVWDGSLNE